MIAQPQNVDKLLNIIGNYPQIIRRNNANQLEVNGHAVTGSKFDELYADIFSPKWIGTYGRHDSADRCAVTTQRQKQRHYF